METPMRLYQDMYPKCGPEPDLLYATNFIFRIGDIVEVVTGRAKGERGPISYIDMKNNYILVSGCNIDYSTRATKNAEPCEVPMLPKHIRLVNPETNETVASEDIELVHDLEDESVKRK